MATYTLQLPRMGESVSEATIVKWLKQPGDRIAEDEPVLEIATDKVDSDVPAPVSGILKEQLFAENDIAQVGEVIATIETEGEEEPEEAQPEVPQAEAAEPAIPGIDQLESTDHVAVPTAAPSSDNAGSRFYSPL